MFIFRPTRGFTLIELIATIVILTIVGGTIFVSINKAAMDSALAVPQKQALAVAESLLDEVMARPFADPTSSEVVIGSAVVAEQRISAHKVDDYHGKTMTGIRRLEAGDPVITALSGYTAEFSVVPTGLGDAPTTHSRLITVTVTGPGGASARVQGFKISDQP